jgi:cytoskeletal protein CcmA (bactofilin family)
MFTKPTKPSKPVTTKAEGAEPAVRKPIAMSLIAENVSVAGDIASDGDIQLDGAVQGDLRVGHLSIGETGKVEGAIEADVVEVRGRVAGAINARSVKLFATALVEGDISHAQLAIEAGAQFTGRSVRLGQAVQEQLALMAAE